jgi:hypothetical protein
MTGLFTQLSLVHIYDSSQLILLHVRPSSLVSTFFLSYFMLFIFSILNFVKWLIESDFFLLIEKKFCQHALKGFRNCLTHPYQER